MAAVIPCASKGEIDSALNAIEQQIGDAHGEAERICGGAALGLATVDQIDRANSLRAAAMRLATVLGVVWAAELPATPDQRAA